MQEVIFEPIREEHRQGVVDVFNYYVKSSFAAYLEKEVPYAFFDMLCRSFQGYPAYVLTYGGKVIGYGGLRAFYPMPEFKRTAEVSYFILPEYTGKGLGYALLKRLEDEAKNMGIASIVAGISSLNGGSIRFHEKNGFAYCGAVKDAGCKNGTLFDVVHMQKFI